ncbi:helix-turn-helix transcriptional regulator [Nonomuraea typhae]|uniref:helix-turn-helix transcriptional regulator n=1 Tax=Nonomuraea typhae TaxID=2603600 RepID=UPI0012FAAC84|nr:AAA family ATPase [Nonomuraea typhae]
MSLTTLRALLDEAVSGKGRIAMVTGAIATGKSTLLYGFAEGAFEQGALPLTATGSRAESEVPLGVLSQLVHNAPLTEEQQEATLGLLSEDTKAKLGTGPSIEHMDVQVVDALTRVLLDLSERCPLVIMVDDVHYADRASQLCLSYLARRVRFAKIMLVFAAADHSPHLQSLFHTEVLRQPHCRPVRLTHLSAEGVARRTAERAGEEAAARYAAPCWELSGGNRLLADALLEDLQETGAPASRYGDAVLACLHRADLRMLMAARGLAVLGEPERLGRLLGESEAGTVKALAALGGVGLLDEGRFRHPAAGAAVLAEVDADERLALHRKAAELTYDDGAPVSLVAQHLLKATYAEEPWALSVLEEAASHALRDDGVETAIEYLKLASRSCDDERRRARIATMLVRAKWRIDPITPTGQLAELTDALHKGNLGGADAVVLAKALLWHGHANDAKEVLSHLAEPDRLDQEAIAEVAAARPWFRGTYPSFLPHLPGLTREQAGTAAASLRVGRRMESAEALASVLAEGPREETIATAEQILRGSHLDEMSMDTVESALLTLTYTDRSGRAAPWCDAFIEEAAARRAPSRQARLSAIRAEIALRRGDLAGAVEDATRALELIPAGSWGVAVGSPLGSLLLAGAAMGRLDDCLSRFDEPVPDAMLETRYGLQYLYGRGRFNLLAEQPRQALRDFMHCGELIRKWEMDVPGFIPWRVDAAEALIQLGQPEEARRLIDDQLTRCRGRSNRVHGIALRVLASVSEPRTRPMLLRQSSDLLQSCGDRYELARALSDLTEAYHAKGEARRAGMLGRRARVLAEACHAAPLSRALARGRRTEPLPEPEHLGESPMLSDAELRVATLAAEGFTNREISGKLFITVSTVEQHLTRIFRKLNVTRRTDLPTSLAREHT